MAAVKCAPIRFASEYAEAIGCLDRGLKDASILAAQVNLAETTTPVCFRIKNHILLAALESDETEAKEHRAAAENDMHTLEALVHTLRSGCAASMKGRRMLALLNSDVRELGRIIKKNASGGVSGKVPKYVRIIHDCVQPTGDGHSLIFRIAEDQYELTVEECLVPGSKSASRMMKDVEALRTELKEVQQSKAVLSKRTDELQARIALIQESLDGWKRWFWVALTLCIVMIFYALPDRKGSRALVQVNTEPGWREVMDPAGHVLDIREGRPIFGRDYRD